MVRQLAAVLAGALLVAGCGGSPRVAALPPLMAAPITPEPMIAAGAPAQGATPPPPTAVDNAPAPPASLRAGATRQAGRALITASATGLSPGVHAFHLHAACDGRPSAHLATLTPLLAGPTGEAATTSAVPAALMQAGATVIVYAGPDPIGAPVLCSRL